MGYYTVFSLRMEGPEEAINKANEEMLSWNDGYIESLITNGVAELKWYEWEDEMKLVAEHNPDVLFILEGDGEDSDDMWQWRAKGTETEFHCFSMPPFTNKNLLTEDEKKN